MLYSGKQDVILQNRCFLEVLLCPQLAITFLSSKLTMISAQELDMTSSFVSKAARIVQRKMEQNPKSERKERKKTQVKEEPETVPDKPNTDPQSNDEVSRL